jgi:hypothetical protein
MQRIRRFIVVDFLQHISTYIYKDADKFGISLPLNPVKKTLK